MNDSEATSSQSTNIDNEIISSRVTTEEIKNNGPENEADDRAEMVNIAVETLITLDKEACKHPDTSKEFEECLIKAEYCLHRFIHYLGKAYPFIVINEAVDRLGYKIRLSSGSYKLYKEGHKILNI